MADTVTDQDVATAMQTGLCQCGCGQPTTVAKSTHRKYGWVKGQPHRFVSGHRANCSRLQPTKDYRAIHVKGRRVRLHVLRAEAALGKKLPPGAEVHHADGSRRDDAPLVICENHAYHMLLHIRMRVQRAGGNPNTEALCGRCRMVKPHAAFSMSRERGNGLDDCCRTCNNEKEKQKRDRQRLMKTEAEHMGLNYHELVTLKRQREAKC